MITGATSVEQVDENLKACEVKHLLTKAVMGEIEEAITGGEEGKQFKVVADPGMRAMRTRKLSLGAMAKL